MDFGISGKKAVVLASSRGLGAGIAEALAKEGAHVLLCGRTPDRLQANCKAINETTPGKADFVVADLSDGNFVETLLAAAEEKLGGIDILVNNCGGPTPGGVAEMSPEKLTAFFNSMVLPVITLTNRVVPKMKEKGWGRILTVASGGVVEPIPNLALSNTLRSALVGWNKTLSTEVAASGITANMLLPGRIHTDRIDELDDANATRSGKSLEEVRKASLASIPAGRLGRVEEFASVAAFLCSKQASYVTGGMIRCDGGATRTV
ncbi:SDR family oxidoreductase [Martelella endophytica]|uniref:3-oxoacyl-ACP reductase n=1 Tax=Martelella endophytica TaxID=1486262 RepID=A0A0D5LR55_MAREN|nr:SDR family oxidoreductase [Martelella endophytica]AJY46400.1 3-oxoacyl-ACP reductase [Martelella endophytica]